MRYKMTPGPPDRELLRAVSEAVPLVPASVEDCCTRIRDRTAIPSREAAREWLTFCQALGLVDETDRGYYRPRDPPDDDALATAFEEGVFGAREVLATLDSADRARGAEAAFEAVRETVPRWERDRSPDWEAEWREQVEQILEWGVVFGHLERTEDGYRVAD
ncbi:MAG: hypothetical protein ACI9HI_001406 [Salinirussus sp.]|jgi:hypothetical protein